jgi:colanic acid/amylovoran biosynthesis glycosyltransferase
MKIAYLVSRFPLLSETFILREMIEVEKLGYQIVLYPIICQDQPVIHDEAKSWVSRANCIPFISPAVLMENIRLFLQNPVRYFYLLWQVFAGNLSSLDFLIRDLYLFPKAVYTAKCLQIEGVDHIHAHYATHPGFEAWLINKLTGISYSITVHSHDIYDCQAMLEPKLRDAIFIAPISNYNINYMEQIVGEWIREKCHVVHCGIDVSRFYPAARKRHRKESDVFELIQVGTFHWKKGQLYLIRAMALLRDRGLRIRLRIIGDGVERPKLEKEIENLNLNSLVLLLGAKTQAEVAVLLPEADCYIQSSVSEGIPVAIMEAMASGLPVVATNITGIPELVLHNQTGLLVPPADVQALADAIYFIMSDPEMSAEMGRLGRLFVQREFDLQKNTAKLADLFKTVKRPGPSHQSGKLGDIADVKA